eukprot:symbB.v1.2.029889.t1/scaffold3304.1/size59434/2
MADGGACPVAWFGKVKIFFAIMAVLLTGVDLWLWQRNQAPVWFLTALALSNGWGWTDAVLRFPLLHDLDSAFSFKHLFLGLLKLAWLILVFTCKKAAPVVFVILAMLTIVMPMIYAIFLPLDEPDTVYNVLKTHYVDEDVCIRLWQAMKNPKKSFEECQEALWRTRSKVLIRGLRELHEHSPKVAEKLHELSPKDCRSPVSKAFFRKNGRTV